MNKTINPTYIGQLWEQVFRNIMDQIGFKEGTDYYKCNKPGYPDFYIKKLNFYVEIKSKTNNGIYYTDKQKEEFKRLKKEGIKVKIFCFDLKIEEYNNIHPISFLNSMVEENKNGRDE